MLQGYNFDHHDRLDGKIKRVRVIEHSLPDALHDIKRQCTLLQAWHPVTPPYDVSDFNFIGAETENRSWIEAGHIEVIPRNDLEEPRMAAAAPDFERGLWTVVSQTVKLYDDERLPQEWLDEANVQGKLHRAGVALAVWYKTLGQMNKNDGTHYAGYYTREDNATAEKFLAVLQLLEYDDENRATNFAESRDQLDDPTLLGPYFFLQRIIPLLNEKGITRPVRDILDTMSPWLNRNQIIWFADDSQNPGNVVLYSTDSDAQLKPAERVIPLPWYTVVAAMRLFLPIELCEHVRRNGEGRHPFMAVLVPYQALADTLGYY